MPKLIVVVSDLHCGSIYGLLPPDFVASDDRVVSQNPGQKYLWDCWDYVSREIRDWPVAAIIINGDAIDGAQQAQKATELCLPMLGDQALAAEETIKHLRAGHPNAPIFFTAGTEYHVQAAAREEEAVARALNARQYRGLGTGHYLREVLDLEVDGVVLNFAHHVGVAGGMYRGTAIDREALFAALAGKDGKYPKCDCLVRSHCHFFYHAELTHRHAVITPCWQLQTRFMRKRGLYRMIPDIGVTYIWIDGEAKKNGQDAITVRKKIFPLPKMVTTHL